MAKQQGNGGIVTLAVVGIVGWMGWKYVLPHIINPIRTANYAARINVQLGHVKMSKTGIEFQLKLQNPNMQPMNLANIVGNVFVNYGRKDVINLGSVAHYAHGGDQVIKPNGETDIEIVVKLSGAGAVLYFLQSAAGASNQVITFLGNITLGVGHNKPAPVHVIESVKVA